MSFNHPNSWFQLGTLRDTFIYYGLLTETTQKLQQ